VEGVRHMRGSWGTAPSVTDLTAGATSPPVGRSYGFRALTSE
jgi:hypothetical protein